jgi:hypothetical protein
VRKCGGVEVSFCLQKQCECWLPQLHSNTSNELQSSSIP